MGGELGVSKKPAKRTLHEISADTLFFFSILFVNNEYFGFHVFSLSLSLSLLNLSSERFFGALVRCKIQDGAHVPQVSYGYRWMYHGIGLLF
jgi:hypothetical protein